MNIDFNYIFRKDLVVLDRLIREQKSVIEHGKSLVAEYTTIIDTFSCIPKCKEDIVKLGIKVKTILDDGYEFNKQNTAHWNEYKSATDDLVYSLSKSSQPNDINAELFDEWRNRVEEYIKLLKEEQKVIESFYKKGGMAYENR